MKNTFSKYNLSDETLKALEALGYNKPSEVQEKVIPEVLLNKDVVVKAQTGSGKTASFAIPLCEKINWELNSPQVLVLTPTRELAIQVKEDIKNVGRFKRIKAVAVFGKHPFNDEKRELKQKTHMLVGTPGRVLDHIDRETVDVSNIKYLVIDEADEMLNMGFIGQVEGVMRRIPKKRVTLLFSATINEEIGGLCDKHMNRPVDIEIKNESVVSKNIIQELYKVNGNEKLEFLNALLINEKPETAVVFCRTKENVDTAYDFYNRLGYSVGKIHGGMLQKERLDAMDAFKRGSFRILIATDVAARGIDVEGITHVFNIDIPLEKEAYVHRIGRTARAGGKGKSITLMTEYENKYLDQIQEYINEEIPVCTFEYSREDIKNKKDEITFLKTRPKKKADKAKNVNDNIMKIYLNGGKKKKIRPLDIVGAITRIENITGDDVGIIDVQDTVSYVDILNGKGKLVLEGLKTATIKGKKLKAEKARK